MSGSMVRLPLEHAALSRIAKTLSGAVTSGIITEIASGFGFRELAGSNKIDKIRSFFWGAPFGREVSHDSRDRHRDHRGRRESTAGERRPRGSETRSASPMTRSGATGSRSTAGRGSVGPVVQATVWTEAGAESYGAF